MRAPRPATSTAKPAPSTVQLNGEPWRGIHLTHRPDRCQRRERHGDAGGRHRSEHHRAQQAKPRVHCHRHRIGAERSQDTEVLIVRPQPPADGQAGDQQGSGTGDGPEHAERDRPGLAGPLDLPGDHRRDVEGVGGAPGQQVDDLPLHRRHVLAAVFEPQPVNRQRFARAQPPGEGRRHQHDSRVAVDVVAGHLGREHDEADEPDRDPGCGFGCGRAERRGARLRHRVGAEPDGLTDVPAAELCRLRRGDHLIGATGVGHPALGHAHAVLAEVHAAVAAGDVYLIAQVGGCGWSGLPARPEREEQKRGSAGDVPHMGKARQPPGQVRRRSATQRFAEVPDLGLHVRSARGGEIRRESGLRSPCARHRSHRHATYQPHEENHGEVATPPHVQGGADTVKGGTPHPPGHGEPAGRCIPPRSDSASAIETPSDCGSAGARSGGGPAGASGLVPTPPMPGPRAWLNGD